MCKIISRGDGLCINTGLVLFCATINWWNVLTFSLTAYILREKKRLKLTGFVFHVSCVIQLKFSSIFLCTLYWSLLHVAQVRDRGNLFPLKLHDRAWIQQAVAWLQSMLLPHALAVCHCCSAAFEWWVCFELTLELGIDALALACSNIQQFLNTLTGKHAGGWTGLMICGLSVAELDFKHADKLSFVSLQFWKVHLALLASGKTVWGRTYKKC